MKTTLTSFLAAVLAAAGLGTPVMALEEAGDLVRCPDNSAVYQIRNGERFTFPDTQTYFSWYTSFNDVRFVECAELAELPLTGVVHYRSGSLIKIPSVPTVYRVDANGVLRPLRSEDEASRLYGDGWASQVHDLPEAFFVYYSVGPELADEELVTSDFVEIRPTYVIGSVDLETGNVYPDHADAVWDACDRYIVEDDRTDALDSCIQSYRDRGIRYLSYHPMSGVEIGNSGFDRLYELFPTLQSDGAYVHLDGSVDQSGTYRLFSNGSQPWRDFIVSMAKTQVDAGFGGLAMDEGWGTLGPGEALDRNPDSIRGFRDYLAARYTEDELREKGIDDITSFSWPDALFNRKVIVVDGLDPGAALSEEWWQEQLGRSLGNNETYTVETFPLANGYADQYDPFMKMFNPEQGDYAYYNRQQLRRIFETLQSEVKPHAQTLGQDWTLSANVYNDLGWGNTFVGAMQLDIPFGEVSYREAQWPSHTFSSFYKTVAGANKRFASMFWPGQVLHPQNDNDTEAVLMFVADAYVSGGISQHPGGERADLVDPFYAFIREHEDWFETTNNRVALYYSLGNHMGDVGRPGEGLEAFYGAGRLLEDTQYSYDVLTQGDPYGGPGTTQWLDQDVGLSQIQRYDVIILPQTRYMTDVEVDRFTSYVQSGGRLVVFGDAGTVNFDDEVRSNATWGSIVLAADAGDLASNYDQVYDDGERQAFIDLMSSTLPKTSNPRRDIYIGSNRTNTQEIFHVVNRDYSMQTDRVTPLSNERVVLHPTRAYRAPRATLYTIDGSTTELSLEKQNDGSLSVVIPSLHIYGAIEVVEAN